MGRLSDKLHTITFGDSIPSVTLQRGNYTHGSPPTFVASPTGSALALVNAEFYAEDGVWNAFWNDYADFQELAGELIPGKCYIDTYDGATISTERCQLGLIGICSDTFGMVVGAGRFEKEVPIAVSGWVLAYVDKMYPCGTPLTNDEFGNLTEMTLEEKRDFPERLIATYKKPEKDKEIGTKNKTVKVDGRHWVKVKS